MNARTARLANNEAVFRAGNEAISANRRDLPERLHEYLCECGDAACFEPVQMTREEYEAVRADSGRFLVVPGHQDLTAGEEVVAVADRYVLVEKTGGEREIVERSDPRRP